MSSGDRKGGKRGGKRGGKKGGRKSKREDGDRKRKLASIVDPMILN